MVDRFISIRELNDNGIEDIYSNVKRLIGNGPQSTTAVLEKNIQDPELTGTNTDDIKALHETMLNVLKVLRGEN